MCGLWAVASTEDFESREWSLSMCFTGWWVFRRGTGFFEYFKVGYEINVDTFGGV